MRVDCRSELHSDRWWIWELTPKLVVRAFGANIFISVLIGTAMSQSAPISTGQLVSRYRLLDEKVRTFSAKCDMVSSFRYQGTACTSSHAFELKRSDGITNIFGGRIATSGFVPTYRHSDGVTHKGIDPTEAEMEFSSGAHHLWLTLRRDKVLSILGARMIGADDGVPDPFVEGHRMPRETALDVPLTKLINGKLQATFQFRDGPSEIIEVDPKLDYMITSRIVGPVASPQSRTDIESVVNAGSIEFPSRISRKTYNKDGSVNQMVSFAYGEFQVGTPVKLWLPKLPPQMTIIGGSSGVLSTDSDGKIISIGTKRKKENGFDGMAVLQFVSLVGMFACGGILLQRLLSRRGRSRALPS